VSIDDLLMTGDVVVPPRLFPSLAALTDPVTLSQLIGHKVEHLRIEPLASVGYSNASLSRVELARLDRACSSFVLKHTRLKEDWTARRTQDSSGREALFLLNQEILGPVWDVFACPYVAFASAPGEIGLLLRDLTTELMPDARVPLSGSQESALLGALAQLHALFWDRSAPALSWLMRPAQYCDLLAPSMASDPAALAVLSSTLQESVPRGWELALTRLPPVIVRYLTRPGIEWEHVWADLPRTLLHGDVKVANFALLGDGRVTAFDWAMVGTGPCTIDLGWYLAVNASRLTASKEEILSKYRLLLESALRHGLSDRLWRRLESVAVVTGARMLLWSKALALEVGRPGAADEWNWWVNRLTTLRPESTAV
jgi:hypothetical protein